MKRLLPAGILLAFVIFAYLFSLNYTVSSCNETEALIAECEESYIKNDDAFEPAKKLSEHWDKKESGLSFFVNHNKIDDVELEIAALELYSKSENQALFLEHIEELKMLLHQIKEDTRLTIHSVF